MENELGRLRPQVSELGLQWKIISVSFLVQTDVEPFHDDITEYRFACPLESKDSDTESV